MHLHFLGICGTFMGSLAIIARQLGHKVTGSDANVYPPMSTQLEEQGIELFEGFDPVQFEPRPDLVVVGNAMSRGNPAVEYMLDNQLPYTSGPQWLGQHVLADRKVLAVSGTHGKTTTASMLAWLLEDNGLKPGYLIGGIPANFSVSADAGEGEFFVIEADEYDTAFFDKRSKFVHYRPWSLIINNLEYDHADIFPDLAAIQRQFHHLIRTVPAAGTVVTPTSVEAIDDTLGMGCWTPVQTFSLEGFGEWRAYKKADDGTSFEIIRGGELQGIVNWSQMGDHNVANGLAAIVAACSIGIEAGKAIDSLCRFKGVKRRMEVIGEVNGVTVYDDFAHHPTAIETTLGGLRARVGESKVIAVLEPRSNTMKMGVHKSQLSDSVASANQAWWFQPEGMGWELDSALDLQGGRQRVYRDIDTLVGDIVAEADAGDHVVIMSNGGFHGIYQRLLGALEQKAAG